MKLIPSSNLISALPVRQLVDMLKLEPQNHEIVIALEMIKPRTSQSDWARKCSHLTHSTEIDHQIRFPLKGRVERSIKKLAQTCSQKLKSLNLIQFQVAISSNDWISLKFFEALEQENITIIYENICDKATSDQLLTLDEKNIIESLKAKTNFESVIRFSQERVYSCDYQTAFNLLSQIPIPSRTDACHHILGLCSNFFGLTENSELHFKKLMQSELTISRIKASYVLSMLYLRLHPKEKQNLELAEYYLQVGQSLIEQNENIPDYTFHSVFNRNGYALCLYRRGKIEEALETLQAGIQKLQTSSDGAKDLHESVLIYNAVQCLRAMGKYSECESMCKKLLSVDPLFPEYSLELASLYLELEEFDKAHQYLKNAENLDAFIPEIHSLKGYLFLNQNKLSEAIKSYQQSLSLAPYNQEFQDNLDYCLHLQNQNEKEISL
jgi:tetratricopeptide (TPR) repeat protein